MAEPPFDPVATWQKFVSDWEKQVNEAAARVVGTEEFSRAMNQVTKFSMVAQQQFEKQMEQVLKAYNLPSRSDIAAIQERLASIEELLQQLQIALGQQSAEVKVDIPRTRRPPSDST
jgi:polyhydroxyalkanoate synthesis regulator phasin